MRRLVYVLSMVTIVAAGLTKCPAIAWAQAKPRTDGPSREATPSRGADRDSPGAQKPDAPRAKPRDQPQARPRPRVPPERVAPPDYFGPRRVYLFPPVSRSRAFYYHPYFGFYFGPYYGPYYPYPGPYVGQFRYSDAAIRTRVKPLETEVYVNGYYAGTVDDFDGVFQRLYLPPGIHVIDLYLAGHESYRQEVRLIPGQTLDIRHQMRPLAAGQSNQPPMTPRSVPDEWRSAPTNGPDGAPSSPFGLLELQVEPPDAQVFVDGELWLTTERRTDFVIHVPSGKHAIEVRKPGYQPFTTELALSAGATARLTIRLVASPPSQ